MKENVAVCFRCCWVLLVTLLLQGSFAMATVVTFQVDLSHEPNLSPNGIHVLGSFNGYDPAATSLTMVGVGQFVVSVNLVSGSQEMYKFVNGDTWQETEGVWGECAFNTYRLLTVPMNDTVLPMVCFGFCDSMCSVPTGRRLAFVGNSITFGYGLSNPALQSFPTVMQNGFGPNTLVGNFGASGTAVIRAAGNPYHLSDPFRHLLRFSPEDVLILLGINDSKAAIWAPFGSRFAVDYDSLWRSIDTLSSNPHCWIGLPTTAFSGLFGIDPVVLTDSIVPKIEAHVRRLALDQIDLHRFTANFTTGFPDGIHPDSAMHHLLATEILRVMQTQRPQLQQSGPQLWVADGYAWQWYRNGDTVATAMGGQSDTLQVTMPGFYKVSVQIDSVLHHRLTSDSLFVVPVQADAPENLRLTVFPNPTKETIFWSIQGFQSATIHLHIFDAIGQTIRQKTEVLHTGQFSLSNLTSGTYYLEFHVDGEVAYRCIRKD
jgi:lysophospholipase L1-like esterase